MIIDTSVIVAILLKEEQFELYIDKISTATRRYISAASFLEMSIVIGKKNNPILNRILDELLEDIEAIIEPVDYKQAQIARAAYKDFGKCSRHKAQLNYGDCFTYALTKVKRDQLLFKGNDFNHTDLDYITF